MAKTIIIDIEKCMGCRSCEFACAVAHSDSKDPETIIITGEKPGYRINIESYGRNAVPVHCNHCEEAACLLACPTGAIHRDSDKGPVLFETERCISCRMCVQACPFGVITISPTGKGVLKCDLCIERLEKGQDPACVAHCPTGALLFIEEEDASKAKRQKTARRLVEARQATDGLEGGAEE
jgi:carbon-monoxide dehydrogenase iron sulfur subunit